MVPLVWDLREIDVRHEARAAGNSHRSGFDQSCLDDFVDGHVPIFAAYGDVLVFFDPESAMPPSHQRASSGCPVIPSSVRRTVLACYWRRSPLGRRTILGREGVLIVSKDHISPTNRQSVYLVTSRFVRRRAS